MSPEDLQSTSLFYTFSTIAQVLAGLIALSGVFLLFKLQQMSHAQLFQLNRFLKLLPPYKIADTSSAVIEYAKFFRYLKQVQELETFTRVGKLMNQIINNPYVQSDPEKCINLHLVRQNYMLIVISRKRILNLTKVSILSGIITIFYSLLVLSCVSLITYPLFYIIYSIGFFGVFLTIIIMVYIIFYSLGDMNYSEFNFNKTEQLIYIEVPQSSNEF